MKLDAMILIRIGLGAVLGAAVLFGWDYLTWEILRVQRLTFAPIPQQAMVDGVLDEVLPDGSVPAYYFVEAPSDRERDVEEAPDGGRSGASTGQTAGDDEEDALDWEPTGVLMRRDGAALEPSMLVVFGGIINVMAVLIAAFLLGVAAGDLHGFRYRLAFVLALGIFVIFVADLPYWLWFGFPTGYTAVLVAQRAVGWLLVGVILGALITPADSVSSDRPGPAPSSDPEPSKLAKQASSD